MAGYLYLAVFQVTSSMKFKNRFKNGLTKTMTTILNLFQDC